MNIDLPPTVTEMLHRVDRLTPPTPPVPLAVGDHWRTTRWVRPGLAVAAVVAAVVTAVSVSQLSPTRSAAAARFPAIAVPSRPPAFLPASLPARYHLANGELLAATPADRGTNVVTGRVEASKILDWTSAWTSPEGMRAWLEPQALEQFATSVRLYDLATYDGEVLVEFDSEHCGRVTVITATNSRDATLAAADTVRCLTNGTLAARARTAVELLYAGPRDSAPNDGLLLRYDSTSGDRISFQLRRIGFPAELAGLTFDARPSLVTYGDKDVTLQHVNGLTSISWSPDPGVLVVVTATPGVDPTALEAFVSSIRPVDDDALQQTCRQTTTQPCP